MKAVQIEIEENLKTNNLMRVRIKKIVYCTILAIVFSYTCNKIDAQSGDKHKFEKAKDSKYIHGTSLRKLHKYNDVFSTHKESFTHFNKFNRNRIKAKRWGFVSIALVVATPIFNSRVLPEGYVDPDPAFLLAVLASSSLAIITGTAAIIFKLRSNSSKSKALSIYNDDVIRNLSPDESHVLSIQTTNNGIGLSLSF